MGMVVFSFFLVVVDQFNVECVRSFEAENDAPVGPHGHGPGPVQVAFERLQTELGTTLYIGFNSTTAQLAYFRSLRFPLVCPSRRSIQVPLPVWPRPFRAPSSAGFRVIPGSQPPQLVSSAAAQSPSGRRGKGRPLSSRARIARVSGLKKARLCRVAPGESYACSAGFFLILTGPLKQAPEHNGLELWHLVL